MRKYFVILVSLVLSISASAQVSIGAGYVNEINANRSIYGDCSNGYYFEGMYTSHESEHWGVSYGLRYINTIKELSEFYTSSFHDIDVPFILNYGVDKSSTRLFAFAGPTLNCGLVHNERLKKDYGDVANDRISDGKDKRFDISLGGGVGIRIKKIQCSVGYDFGLLNVNKDDPYTTHVSRLRIGIAYIL